MVKPGDFSKRRIVWRRGDTVMKRERWFGLVEELESRARSHVLPKLDFGGVLADYFLHSLRLLVFVIRYAAQ